MEGVLSDGIFLHPILVHVMTSSEQEMLTMFLKLKSSLLYGFERDDTYDFILYFYERLHKLGMVYQLGYLFVVFHLQVKAK